MMVSILFWSWLLLAMPSLLAVASLSYLDGLTKLLQRMAGGASRLHLLLRGPPPLSPLSRS